MLILPTPPHPTEPPRGIIPTCMQPQDICSYFGPTDQVKVIKDKATGASLGYGFVRFLDRRCALVALQYLNVSRAE